MAEIEPWLRNFMIGDAYGAGFEMRPDFYIKEHNDGKTYRQHGLDTTHQPGETTDDTQMTLAVRHVVDRGFGYDPKAFAREFCELYRKRAAPGYGSGMRELLPMAVTQPEPGGFLIRECRRNTAKDRCGAAMRAIPCGRSRFGEFESVVLHAVSQARVTHHHPDSIDAAIVVALAANLPDKSGRREAARYVGWEDPDRWDPKEWDRHRFPTAGKPIVQMALWLLETRSSLLELLLEATSYGGDTDTLSALCLGLGTLAGKPNDLPDELVDKLVLPESEIWF